MSQPPRPGPRQREPPPKMTSEEAAKKRMDPGPTSARSAVVVSHSREATWARNRTTLNALRVTKECAPYLEEGRLINKRAAELDHEMQRISLQLDVFRITQKELNSGHGLLDGSMQTKKHKKKEHISSLQTLYAMELLQKKEERMRLQDRLTEINKIIRSIYRNYEDMRQFDGVGGRRTRSKSKKHKWSLKYKRSINCKKTKGFSQRQYCAK